MNTSSTILINEFDYTLPNAQIAEYPLSKRDESRLLVYRDGEIEDDRFQNLSNLLPDSTSIVLNNTKVIEARLFFQKETGAHIEIFCLSPYEPSSIDDALKAEQGCLWFCLIGGASKWGHGLILHKEVSINDEKVTLNAKFVGKSGDQFIIGFSWLSEHTFSEILHAAGSIPLPPYIKRKAITADQDRYQTVFAQHQGSVAAPTAALHFTENVFTALEERGIHRHYVTLHVGAGTFKPVKSATIEEHQMHAEHFSVSAATLKGLIHAESIIAVGTTSLRTLESLHWLGVKLYKGDVDFTLQQWEAYSLTETVLSYKDSLQLLVAYLEKNNLNRLECQTSLLIRPGYQYKSADALITNFHQPKSTLLLLVAAFIGEDWKKVYEHALENQYRFLSYGDSSLLWRKGGPLSPEGGT